MLLKENIKQYLLEINTELVKHDVKGEIVLYGGAVMCLAYEARPSTKDVDAIFKPSTLIRDIAKKIASKFDLEDDWLNDGVKGFLVDHNKSILFNWSNLVVYMADAEYLLAMKALASRVDGTDKDDIIFLIMKLNLKTIKDVFNIIENYYPKKVIKPATQFFIEEIFDRDLNL
jgi:hypothetical protein